MSSPCEELIYRIVPWVQEMRRGLIHSHTLGCTDDPEDIPDFHSDVRREVNFLTKWLKDAGEVIEISPEDAEQ